MLASLILIMSQVSLVAVLTWADMSSTRPLRRSVRLLIGLVLAVAAPATLSGWLLMAGIGVTAGALASALLLFAIAMLWWRRAEHQASQPTVRDLASGLLLAIPMILPAFVQFIGALLKPEASVDGLLYHGPALANIVSHNSLFGWESANEYLYFSDLQMVLAALWIPITETVRLEDAVQAPFFAIAVLAIYVASSVTGRNRMLRMWLALVVVLAPVMWTQGRVLYVDVAAAALLGAGIALALAAVRQRAGGILVISALAIGASVATKPSALFAGTATLLVVIGVAAWLRHWQAALLSILAFALSASPFYVRNLLSFANPFYPIATDLGPMKFPGLVDSARFNPSGAPESLLDPTRVLDFGHNLLKGVVSGTPRWLYDPREGGFDRTPAIVLGLIVLSIVVLAITAGRSRTRFRSVDAAWWLLPALALILASVQPNPSDSRYVMGAYLCLAAALIALVSVAPTNVRAETGLTLLTALIALGMMWISEQRMLFGIPESLHLRASDTTYNTGVDGGTVAYGDRYSWLQDTECLTVMLQTHGGLTPVGMPGEGMLTTYSYPAWGDRLCNDVEFVPTPELTEADQVIESDHVRQELHDADYLVIKTLNRGSWDKVLAEEGLTVTEVTSIESAEYFPIAETVLRVIPQ